MSRVAPCDLEGSAPPPEGSPQGAGLSAPPRPPPGPSRARPAHASPASQPGAGRAAVLAAGGWGLRPSCPCGRGEAPGGEALRLGLRCEAATPVASPAAAWGSWGLQDGGLGLARGGPLGRGRRTGVRGGQPGLQLRPEQGGWGRGLPGGLAEVGAGHGAQQAQLGTGRLQAAVTTRGPGPGPGVMGREPRAPRAGTRRVSPTEAEGERPSRERGRRASSLEPGSHHIRL